MNVSVVAPARDLGKWAGLFIEQCKALAGASFKFVVVEGDSVDNTLRDFEEWASQDKRVRIITYNTGNAKHDSTLHPDRLAHIATIANKGIDAAMEDNPDYIMVTPSDVEFQPDIVTRLLANKVEYVAPMFWVRNGAGARFYDIWGFAEENERWGPKQQTWYSEHKADPLIKMKTVGGCVLIDAKLIEAGARYSPVDCDHGLCRAVQEMGVNVYADTTTHIYHR